MGARSSWPTTGWTSRGCGRLAPGKRPDSRRRACGCLRTERAARSSGGRRGEGSLGRSSMTSRPVALLVVLAACAHNPASSAATPPPTEAVALPPRTVLRGPPHDEEGQRLGAEAAALLSRDVRINTTNPPGNELQAARWLATVLRRGGGGGESSAPPPGHGK